jgi:hypothetical protein
VCGSRLKWPEVRQGLFPRTERTYPFETMKGGERKERPVRWLCARCERRAARHREND